MGKDVKMEFSQSLIDKNVFLNCEDRYKQDNAKSVRTLKDKTETKHIGQNLIFHIRGVNIFLELYRNINTDLFNKKFKQ